MSRKRGTHLQATNRSISVTQIDEESFLPPETIQQYKNIDPQFVSFFIDQSKKEQKARINLEKTRDRRAYNIAMQDFRINKLGVWLAFFLILVIFVASIYFIQLGTMVSIPTGIGTMVVAFIGLLKIFASKNSRTSKK